MSITVRFVNLPWTLTRNDLTKFLSQYMNGRVRYSKIFYDRQTGLSRGIGLAAMQDDKLNMNLLKRGSLEIDGRNVIVHRVNRSDENASIKSNDPSNV